MKVHFKKGVVPLVFFMTLFGFEKELMWGYMASILHECAHLFMSTHLNCTPVSVTFGVCAMNLEIQRVTNTGKHMKILAMGPISSFAMFAALFCLRKFSLLDLRIFEFANLCIGIANLFPATPLDGGRILKLFLSSRFGIMCGAKIMRGITYAIISLLVIANALLLLLDGPNPFLFIFLSFLFFSLLKEKREDLFLTKLVFSGQIPSSSKVKYISFSSDCRLLDISCRVSHSYYLVGAIFDEGRFVGEIFQDELQSALKLSGAMTPAGDYLKSKDAPQKIYAIENLP